MKGTHQQQSTTAQRCSLVLSMQGNATSQPCSVWNTVAGSFCLACKLPCEVWHSPSALSTSALGPFLLRLAVNCSGLREAWAAT